MKKTVVFDFDGVIHSYKNGWQGPLNIPDPPVEGIKDALREIHGAGYEVIVVSTRCAHWGGQAAIEAWLRDYGLDAYIDDVYTEKPPAIVYIDDRAICFDGNPETLLSKIKTFKPWYQKEPGMSFGEAIEALKHGKKVRRRGWHWKGIFIESRTLDGNSQMAGPYIFVDAKGIQTHSPGAPKDGTIWDATQTDILSEDWEVVE